MLLYFVYTNEEIKMFKDIVIRLKEELKHLEGTLQFCSGDEKAYNEMMIVRVRNAIYSLEGGEI
jgi:predicted membrane-bound spermidine synthase